MIRRYVSRARGKALRAAGVPNLPNLPSARALAQRELRNAGRVGVRRPARRAGSFADGPADRPPTDPSGRPANPYDDPSRDVGEGPDTLTRPQGIMLMVGLIIFVWLLTSTSDVPPPAPPTDHCHTSCEESP